MKPYITFLYLSSILFSVIIAFVYRNHLKRKGIIILLPFLFLALIQEVSIYFYRIQNPNSSTSIVYNFYRVVAVLVFSYVFYQVPFRTIIKKIGAILLSLYLTLIILTFTLLQSIYSQSNYPATAAGLIITSYGIFFLFFYFNLDDPNEQKKWKFMIPIAVGLIFFYPVINISNVFHRHLLTYQATIGGMNLYNLIPMIMSIFMYSCFARAFYLCKKKN